MPAQTLIACQSASDAQRLASALMTAGHGADAAFTNNSQVELTWRVASPALPAAALSTARAASGVVPVSVTHVSAGQVTKA